MTEPLTEQPKRAPARRKRSPRITTRMIAEALQSTSGLAVLAAKRLGCSPSVIYNRMRDEPALREIQEYAREEIVDMAEGALRVCVGNREPWAVQFALRTIGRTRGYTEPSRYTLELSGQVAGTMEHKHVMQHIIQGMADDPTYLEAARQRAIEDNTLDSFARPVGAAPSLDPLTQSASVPPPENH